MKIKDVMEQSCDLLGLVNERKLIENATLATEVTVLANDNVHNLFDLIKFSLQELCTHYVPVANQVEIQTTNKQYSLSSLTNYIRVQNVFKNGEIVKYKILNRNIVFDVDGIYTVNYLTYPEVTSIFDEIDFLSNFSPDIIVFGLCAYYALSHGMFDDFNNLHEKYIEKAEAIKDLRIFEMPKRRWE